MAKKKSKAVPIIAGVLALGVIGMAMPEKDDSPSPSSPPAIEALADGEETSTVTPEILPSESPLPSPDVTETIEPTPTTEPPAPGETSAPEKTAAPTPSPAPTPEPTPVPTPEPSESEPPKQTEATVPSQAPAENLEQAFRDSLLQYNYVGSKESDKYHYPRCQWTSKINDQNLVHFETVEEAENAGYKPCGTCHPK